MDLPPDQNGIQEAMQVAHRLSQVPAYATLTTPLQRGMIMAQLIGRANGSQVMPVPFLRPWNMGYLTGKPINDALPEIKYYMAHPSEAIPDGESYGDFYQMTRDGLTKLIQGSAQFNEPVIAVTHSKNLVAIPSILSGGQHFIPPHGGPAPGSITTLDIDPETGKWTFAPNENPIVGGGQTDAEMGGVQMGQSPGASDVAQGF